MACHVPHSQTAHDRRMIIEIGIFRGLQPRYDLQVGTISRTGEAAHGVDYNSRFSGIGTPCLGLY